MDLSIIIVNWNTGKLLDNCIISIKEQTKNIKFEILVFDNNSSDNSLQIIMKEHNDVIIINSEENLGFSKGNNKAAKQAIGEYLLLLNPDTYILDNAIEKTLSFIKTASNKCIVGCKLLNKDKSIQLSSSHYPSIKKAFLGGHAYNLEQHQSDHETDWIMGAFMLIKNEVFKNLGGFDEGYFMYSEDMDLCFRLKRDSGKIYYFSQANIIHYYNQSGLQKWDNKRDKVARESVSLFLKKNFKWGNYVLCNFMYYLRFLAKKSVEKFKNYRHRKAHRHYEQLDKRGEV